MLGGLPWGAVGTVHKLGLDGPIRQPRQIVNNVHLGLGLVVHVDLDGVGIVGLF